MQHSEAMLHAAAACACLACALASGVRVVVAVQRLEARPRVRRADLLLCKAPTVLPCAALCAEILRALYAKMWYYQAPVRSPTIVVILRHTLLLSHWKRYVSLDQIAASDLADQNVRCGPKLWFT